MNLNQKRLSQPLAAKSLSKQTFKKRTILPQNLFKLQVRI